MTATRFRASSRDPIRSFRSEDSLLQPTALGDRPGCQKSDPVDMWIVQSVPVEWGVEV